MKQRMLLTIFLFFCVLGLMAGEKKTEKPVAFLLDPQGDVLLERKGVSKKVDGSCVALENGDSLNLAEKASVTVMYSDALFSLRGVQSYTVTKQDVITREKKGTKKVEPQFSSRGFALGPNSKQLFVPPAEILGDVAATTTRAGDSLQIFAPSGKVYSLTPEIITAGKKGKNYSVSIISLSEDDTYAPTTVIGYHLLWTDTKWSQLKNDAVYKVEVKQGGKIVTDPEQAFFTASKEEMVAIAKALNAIDKMDANTFSKLFAKANILYQSECYCESRIYFQKLHTMKPKDKIVLKYLEHCYDKLGFSDEVKAIKKKLGAN